MTRIRRLGMRGVHNESDLRFAIFVVSSNLKIASLSLFSWNFRCAAGVGLGQRVLPIEHRMPAGVSLISR